MPRPDETHAPALTSIVDSANGEGTEFPIQNLPFGRFRRDSHGRPRVGVAIGDAVLDLSAPAVWDVLGGDVAWGGLDARAVAAACRESSLNALMGMGRGPQGVLRRALSRVLRAGPTDGDRRRRLSPHLLARAECEMLVPADVGDYSDFYASIHHATNVGTMLRPDSPLLPNYKYVPIGYHGRASSIVASGAPVFRPSGQTMPPTAPAPAFGPSRALDYECEVGAFVGSGSSYGRTIPIADAEQHLFGLCLVNDWSARDIQTWEYQPLGPFLSKSFATTVSPWVVTMDALAPFRLPAPPRPAGDPAPLAYLRGEDDVAHGAFAIALEVTLRSRAMREQGIAAARLSLASFASMYWTLAQMTTHHASNGCNLRPGDLIASGTVSGADAGSRGCLLELTRRGAEPVVLPGGETRAFLEDGDEVTLHGWCEREGYRRIGFGECRGEVSSRV
ncbi:MAG: fumarylacetoacetase [Gemmatimonadaceae bacterium]